ncbi:hypothetical protein [Teichococcus rhizosphaerae]|uniref:hypothetical protein n=1 Tax=Teichococcus rhizosphaerae TaxID=1335062 RepID=UPI001145DABB|nr:hypothetical protein [Pseudoroseomonas rhizosphaerae]
MTTARSRARDLAPELRSVVLTHYPDAETLDLMRPGGEVPLAVLQEANRAVAAEMLRQGVVVLVQQADRAAARRWRDAWQDGAGGPAAWRDRSRLLHGAEALRRIGVEAPAPSRPEKGAGTPADRLVRLFASEDGAAFEACTEALIAQGRDGVLEQVARKVAQIARYDRPDTLFVSAALEPYAAALDVCSPALAQHHGMSSSMRLLGQPLTSRVSTSVK